MRQAPFGSGRRPRRSALAAFSVLIITMAQVLIGAASASALPKGAYWYTLLDLPRTWTISEGAGVTVAVVDSGVKASIGDLRGQVLPGLDLSGADPDAHFDAPLPGEGNFGHGTGMAVLIAGSGRGGGLKGVAPKAKILPIDADAGQNDLDLDNVVKGIVWATDHGAKIINLSLGSTGPCTPGERRAVAYAYRHDVIVVVAAGDDGGSVATPASCPGALAVGAVDSAIKPWIKTATGPEIAFVAPGYGLVNELLDGSLSGPFPGNAGTSQAAAMVSGTLAVLRSKFPHESARQIVTRALYNVHNGLGAGHQGERAGDALGYGMILPRYALTEAPPANAANPIYDRFAREIGPGQGVTGSTSAPAPSASASLAPSDAAGPASSSGDDSGSSATTTLVVVVVVVVVALLVGGVLVARRRRSAHPPVGWYGR